MPLPVINYSAQQTQGSPLGKGMLPAIKQGLELGYLPREKNASLEQKRLANALSESVLPYAGQMAQQGLQQAQMQNQYYPQNMQSQIDLRGVQADMIPKQYALDVEKERRVSERFDDAYKFTNRLNAMGPNQRDLMFAQYPDQMNALALAAGNEALRGVAGSGANYGRQGAPNDPNIPNGLTLSNDQISTMGGAPAQDDLGSAISNSGFNAMPVHPSMRGQSLADPFTSDDEKTKRMQIAAQISANKSLVTPGTQEQLEGAIQLGEIMNQPRFRDKLINASKYAGAKGKGKAALDALTKNNKEVYNDYNSFVNNDMVWFENRIKQLDNMATSDSSMKELKNAYKNTMGLMTSNPEEFLRAFNNLADSIETVGESVEVSANPLGFPSRVKKFKPIPLDAGSKAKDKAPSVELTYDEDSGDFL